MAKSKAKKLAKKKSPNRAPARRPQPKVQAQEHVLLAPSAAALTYPVSVLVHKGAERLPVQVKDAAHFARLVDEFGDKNVVVQL